MLTAVGARLNPITIITGPTTTGGSKCINQPVPLKRIKIPIMTYIKPLMKSATNMSPKLCVLNPVMIGVMKAKLEPKYAGILALVMSMYNNVPIPDASNAAEIGSPVKNGTSTVDPNIANKCCKLKNAHCAGFGLSLTSNTGCTVLSNICSFSMVIHFLS
ncbi:Uncharacterised protein [Streptococcus pneumoniae]|nr:Uncharacterised protein [Streptococcus pneumoniae]